MKRTKRNKIITFFAIPLLIIFLITACGAPKKLIYTEDELAQILKERLTPEEYETTPIPFAIPDELKTYAKLLTNNMIYISNKTKRLLSVIIEQNKLNIKYRKYKTLTALEVLVSGEANCIAYTNLFIGMARAAGLKAYYVDVTEVWKLEREGELVVNSGHICAGVGIKGGFNFLFVDFSQRSNIDYRFYKVIDDLEAMANFENSLGVIASRRPGYYNKKPIPDDDISYFKKAVKIKPSFAKAYNNLGIAYQRRGTHEKAITMYKKAILYAPDLPAAHGNLGNVYSISGRYKEAEEELKKAISLRKNDPYFHYNLGLVYYNLKDYQKAKNEFEYTTKQLANFAEAHNLLGIVYFYLGNKERAKKELEKALELNPKLTQAKIYLKKIGKNQPINP
jgi:tetratricopeptide (TPR) repeat protein